ncbi:glutamate racemase [Maribellus maritimus]|uniref:glutamate racemase n=1 Tax=Maribellus maritimus TaxID=2870838 RepID=UPI001EEAB486|nr:glutamate racemase [Maribellus maritimus]MCG6186705.1 glutamate racemase [Maribellus maritimus]
MKRTPIGIFDSGYGGLTVLKEIVKTLPEYDFLYLGDNARNPYGTRSFKVVYEYTLEAVKYLFSQNCHLIIIACNTASAKALRNIQQLNLPKIAPERRVLGVIRPSVEKVAEITKNGHVGVLGTVGTVTSESYPIELQKWSEGRVKSTVQEACPMWVPIVENNEIETEGAEYFIKKNIENIFVKDKEIDTLILGCTHYPLLINSIQKYVPKGVRILEQGEIVAEKLVDYLVRHPEIDSKISKNATIEFQTTEVAKNFEEKAALFLEKEVSAHTVHL